MASRSQACAGRRDEHPDSFVTRRYIPPQDPLSARFSRPGEPLIWPGQFILGYPTQDEFTEGPGPTAQPPEAWMRNGSFAVVRRLRQHVEAFRAFAAGQAATASAALGRKVTPRRSRRGWSGDGRTATRSSGGRNRARSPRAGR